MKKIEKKELVEKLKVDIFSKNFILIGFNGLSVLEIETLRNNLRINGCSSNVIKNRLLLIALNELSLFGFDNYLMDKNILSIQKNSESFSGLKEIYNFSKSNSKIFIKAGIIDGRLYNCQDLEAIAILPSKDVLLSMLLNLLNTPIYKLVYALNTPISKLVYALSSIKDKKTRGI